MSRVCLRKFHIRLTNGCRQLMTDLLHPRCPTNSNSGSASSFSSENQGYRLMQYRTVGFSMLKSTRISWRQSKNVASRNLSPVQCMERVQLPFGISNHGTSLRASVCRTFDRLQNSILLAQMTLLRTCVIARCTGYFVKTKSHLQALTLSMPVNTR